MNRLDTFKKQQALKTKLASKPLLHKVVPQEEVDTILQCEIDESRLRSLDHGNDLVYSLDANPTEIKALLAELSGNFNKERFDSLMAQTEHDLLHSIAAPFGLGKILSAYDKTGGNVDTIHNVRNGVYATDEEKVAYENRGKYDTNVVHKDEKFINKNREVSKAWNSDDGLQDSYSDNTLGKQDKYNLDHVISAKQTHEDAGRVLAGLRTEDLSNIPENLTPTSKYINSSKGAKSPDEFALYVEKNRPEKQAKIQELNEKSNVSILTNREMNKLNTLNALKNANPEKIREKGKQAKEAQDKHINGEYYLSDKFRTNTLHTSATEGVKTAAQQAFGLLLIELFANSFNEIKAAFNQGLEGESLHQDICIRLKRIGNNISVNRKDLFDVGIAGLISGFISNIVTVLINVFATSTKRLVRMIREGIFSLLKALKTLLFPPAGMTYREAAHEAMKLLVAGGLIATGVVIEEVVEKFILSIPFLMPIAQIITVVIVGSITVMVTALLLYLINKLDLFNVIKIEQDKYIIESLDNNIQSKLESCERIALQIDDYLPLVQ